MNLNLHEKLQSVGYFSNNQIDSALNISIALQKPLLIEGDPGVGKSSLASATAKALGLDFIRVQLYDGLTDDKIMYDYDYQKQLLVLEMMKPFIEIECKGKSLEEIMNYLPKTIDFYGTDFLIKRPLLKSIDGTTKKVLLLDEIDKASEEIEYMLYEFLEDFTITIPQFGKYEVPEDLKPIVFLTSNNYRELSGALKRRCNYLYIDRKNEKELIEILKTKVNVDDDLAKGIAICLTKANNNGFAKPPSISEGIEWARYLKEGNKTKGDVLNTLSIIIKNKKDLDKMKKIIDESGNLLYSF